MSKHQTNIRETRIETPREKSQGNPLTLAAIREAREGKATGFVDTTSLESFIKTCSV